MRATVEYPGVMEVYSQQFNHPWLAKGDGIIVEGDPTAFGADLANFEFVRRAQIRELEVGIISRFCAGQAHVITSAHEELLFEIQDVLLPDCRDFYRFDPQSANYYPHLEQTFDVNEQVFFIRESDQRIRVFLPNTSFGETDPIANNIVDELSSCLSKRIPVCTAKPLPPCYYQACAPMSSHHAPKQSGFMYRKNSPTALSCPDVSACWDP